MSHIPVFLGCKRLLQHREENSVPEIVRGRGQYLYDSENNEYLDCMNSVAIVGHGNHYVVQSLIQQMAVSADVRPAVTKAPEINYINQIKETLPSYLDSLLFCNSGTEAVDLALQIAKLKTKAKDIIIVEGSFHGATESTWKISPKINKCRENFDYTPEGTHTLPIPNFLEGDKSALERHKIYLKEIIEKIKSRNSNIACFLCEPLLVIPGCITPPKSWLQQVYRIIHEAGGLCVADEVQAGLGRIGTHFWSFQYQEVSPDFVIIGKGIGNGYPFSILATTSHLSSLLNHKVKDYQCSPIVNSVGCAVLAQLRENELLKPVSVTGNELNIALLKIKESNQIIRDVRAIGLLIAIEIGACKDTQRNCEEISQDIVSRLRKNRILVANVGKERNIIILMPPLCFTKRDALHFAKKFSEVLKDIKEFPNNFEMGPDHNNSSVRSRNEEGACSLSCTYNWEPDVCAFEGRIGIFQGCQIEFPSNETPDNLFIPRSYDDPD